MRDETEPTWLAYLRDLRAYELAFVLRLFRTEVPSNSGCALLEIGAGTGAQARDLERDGFRVAAVDVADSNYTAARVYPVTTYDGHRLPFEDKQFDVVFSSNVLEHIPHVVSFQAEIQRVLADDGLAVHVLPSTMWRLWTTIAYYPYVLSALWNSRAAKSAIRRRAKTMDVRPRWKTLVRALVPSRHGEAGNWLTEPWYFRRSRWKKLFEDTGWNVVGCEASGIFYSGYSVLGPRLPLRFRCLLSLVLGSATNVFLLRKGAPRSQG